MNPHSKEALQAELQRINPVELLYCEDFAEMAIIEPYKGLRRRPIWEFELSTAISELNRQFGYERFTRIWCRKVPPILAAAGCLLQYAKETQRSSLPHIQSISVIQNNDNIQLDAATRRNLELTQNLAGGTENTLASVLDKCVTPMGSRLLKRWIHQPIRQTDILLKRQKPLGKLLSKICITNCRLICNKWGYGTYSCSYSTAFRTSSRSHAFTYCIRTN